MKKDMPMKMVFSPKSGQDDLTKLVSRWSAGVVVTITNPTTIVRGGMQVHPENIIMTSIYYITRYPD